MVHLQSAVYVAQVYENHSRLTVFEVVDPRREFSEVAVTKSVVRGDPLLRI